MKCSRCGEECKDNQAFCLKCGTPIQVVPDFNLIEAELADNVGKLLNEDKDKKKDSDDMDYLDDERYEEMMPERDIDAELSLVDIEKLRDTMDFNNYQVDATNFTDEEEEPSIRHHDPEIQREKKMFKIKAIVLSVLAAIIILIAVILLNVLNDKDESKTTFVSLYNAGYDFYAAKEYEKALDKLIEAKKLAGNDNERIKVNKSILASYENLENKDTEMISILKELINLDPKEYEYYEKLVAIYDRNDMIDDISELIDSVTDVTISSRLSEYSVSTPKFSEEAGNYDSYISLKLTTSGKNKIYYTLDGTEPTQNSTEYTEEIRLDKEGEFTVKAIAVNEKGISSKVVTNEYKITPSVIEGPEVTPDGGQYNTETEIVVNVPEGMKCYYTYGPEAKSPTVTDTEYTEPVKMLRGKNIFSAMLVSEAGIVSEVTQNIYQLSVKRAITYDDALTILKKYLVDNKIAVKVNEEEFVKPDGHMITFGYNSITIIDGSEYYVIDAEEKDSTGVKVNVTNYGVDTVTGSLKVLEKDAENAGKYIITE